MLASSAAQIEDHRCGFVDRLASSMNTFAARTRYQGLAS